MNLIETAERIAREAHKDQKRKWSDDPYFVHPERVAKKVSELKGTNEVDVAAAYCHDILEDTDYPREEIERQLGSEVLSLVFELTNPTHTPEWDKKRRIEKRLADWQHLLTISDRAKRIKMVDRWDNLQDMFGTPNSFLRKYLTESRIVLEILKPADYDMAKELEAVIHKSELLVYPDER